MPIPRILLSAYCIAAFGTAAAVGQQDGPFAEWGSKQPKTPVSRPATTGEKAAVKYFSPKSSQPIAEEAPVGTTEQVPMRERISEPAQQPTNPQVASTPTTPRHAIDTGPAETVVVTRPPAAAQATSVKPANGTRGTFEWQNKPAEKISTVTPSGSSVSTEAIPLYNTPAVISAAFGTASDSAKIGRVIQVSGVAGAQVGEAGNPFVNLLRDSEKSNAAAGAGLPSNTPKEATVGVKSGAALSLDTPEKLNPAGEATAPPNLSVTSPRPSADGSGAGSGPQSPGVTVQWVRKGAFNVGQECDIELVVQNTSKAIVRSVVTEVVIPADVEVVGTNPDPMQGTDNPTWTFGELQPGESRSVALKVVPRQRGDVRLDAFVRLTGFSSSEFAVEEPMIGVAVTGPENVEVGQQAGYIVRVSNPGTGVASNVVIQAAIPEGLEHRSGSLLTIEIGTLNPGEFRQARLSLTAIKGGAHELAVRVLADGGLTDETLANVSVSEPKLNMVMTGPADQMAGRNGNYSLTVSNAGNVPSANVRAKYRIPEGFEYISADRGGKYAAADHSIEWFVGTLQPSDSSDFNVTLKAMETGTLLHQAGVISEHGQVTMCDLVTDVKGSAALDMTITASATRLTIGDEIEWIVAVKNIGTSGASDVGISGELPSGLELIEAEGPSEHIAENGVMVFRSLPTIEAGKVAIFRIKARCLREGSDRLRLRVASESITEPLIGEELTEVAGR